MRTRKTLIALAVSAGTLLSSTFITQAQTTPQTAPQTQPLTLSGLGLGALTSDLTTAHGNPTALVLGEGGNPSSQQTPPQKLTLLNLNSLPEWAKSVVPQLDADHVLWLYRRNNYTLAFQLNRQGIVDAALVAGQVASRSTATQLNGSNGVINLGDDVRKVLSHFRYPDSIQTYRNSTGQSPVSVLYYNSLVFTIRNNCVARIHIDSAARPG